MRTFERKEVHRSRAMESVGRRVQAAANVPMKQVEFFDIYSCFPSAVQTACREMGIPMEDGYKLTLTGGLPFHGGPGNNYSLHGAAAMAETLRKPANRGKFGLVTANGGMVVTEHSVAMYSTTPYSVTHPDAARTGWVREDWRAEQEKINAAGEAARPAFTETPEGACVVDLYTVEHNQDGSAARALIQGTLTSGPESGKRFVAVSSEEPVIRRLIDEDGFGLPGFVRTDMNAGPRLTCAIPLYERNRPGAIFWVKTTHPIPPHLTSPRRSPSHLLPPHPTPSLLIPFYPIPPHRTTSHHTTAHRGPSEPLVFRRPHVCWPVRVGPLLLGSVE